MKFKPGDKIVYYCPGRSCICNRASDNVIKHTGTIVCSSGQDYDNGANMHHQSYDYTNKIGESHRAWDIHLRLAKKAKGLDGRKIYR